MDEHGKRRGLRQVPAVRTEMDSGNDDFPVPRGDDLLDLCSHLRERTRRTRSSCARNDAVAAAFLATRLHAQGEGRATGDTGLERRAARAVAFAESRRRREAATVRPAPRARSSLCSFGTRCATRRETPADRRDAAWRSSRSRRSARRGCSVQCAGSSGVPLDRPSPSPSTC